MERLNINKSLVLLTLYIQLVLFILIILVSYIKGFDFSYDFYHYLLAIIFFECVLISTIDKIFNIYQIFLFMMFLFNVGLPIFVLFNLFDYPPGNRILFGDGMETVISKETLSQTYLVITLMLLGSSVGWLIGTLKFKINIKRSILIKSTGNKYEKNLKKLFYILLLLVIYKNIELVYNSIIYGYVEVMHLQSLNLKISYVLIIADILFKMSGYALLFLSKNSKQYVKYSILFMIPYSIQIFAGARGETIAVLLTIIFIYSKFYKKINLKKLVPSAFLILIFSTAFGIYRFTRDFGSLISEISIPKLLSLGIISNSSSMGVIAYTIELKDQFFNKIPFLFGYVQGIFSFAPNYTLEGIQNKNYLAQHLTYLLNSDKLYRGSTIGTSMGAEFYEFSNGNFFLIFILSILLLYVTCYFISRLNKNVFMFYLGALFLELLWLSPRGSIMKIFNKESLFSLVILIFVVYLSRVVIKSKKTRNIHN